MQDRARQVAEYFDRHENYLGLVNLATRRELVGELVGELRDARVLDVGCGDGSLTRQFLGFGNRLTYLDLSPEMLERARAAVPPDLLETVAFEHRDLLQLEAPESFDVITCVGVLAHVPDVPAALRKLAELLAPGGRLVLQFSDHARLSYLPHRTWREVRNRVRPAHGYRLNATTTSAVRAAADAAGLRWRTERRYVELPPVVRRFVRGEAAHRFEQLTRRLPLSVRWGHEAIVLLTK